MKVTNADGTQGHLLYGATGYFFRVYDRTVTPWTFKDYDLLHCDLGVTIDDVDASFYEHPDGTMTLDHSPSTLGYRQEFGVEE